MQSSMKLEYLNFINNYLTAVYYTSDIGWRYSIVLQDGSFFQPYDVYDSAKEAYETAKDIIFLVVSCDKESETSY